MSWDCMRWTVIDRGELTSLMYKELMEINEKNINTEKLTKDMYCKFPNDEMQFTNKHMKRCLSPWIIKNTQIKVRCNILLPD